MELGILLRGGRRGGSVLLILDEVCSVFPNILLANNSVMCVVTGFDGWH